MPVWATLLLLAAYKVEAAADVDRKAGTLAQNLIILGVVVIAFWFLAAVCFCLWQGFKAVNAESKIEADLSKIEADLQVALARIEAESASRLIPPAGHFGPAFRELANDLVWIDNGD